MSNYSDYDIEKIKDEVVEQVKDEIIGHLIHTQESINNDYLEWAKDNGFDEECETSLSSNLIMIESIIAWIKSNIK